MRLDNIERVLTRPVAEGDNGGGGQRDGANGIVREAVDVGKQTMALEGQWDKAIVRGRKAVEKTKNFCSQARWWQQESSVKRQGTKEDTVSYMDRC